MCVSTVRGVSVSAVGGGVDGSGGDEGSDSVRHNSGAGAHINTGLVGHGSGGYGDNGGSVSHHGGGVGVGHYGSDGVRHHSGAGDDVDAGLVRHRGGSYVGDDGSGVGEVSQGALLQVVSVTGVAESGVGQQGSGVDTVGYNGGSDGVAHDGGAGAHIHTGLVGHGGGSGDHSGSGYHGVGNRHDGSVREGSVVSIQGLSLQVEGAGVDHLGGVERAAVWVQHDGGVMRRLRQRHQGAARHGAHSE